MLAVLGTGGMGAVYLARHRMMERMVALKTISSHWIDKPGAIERFRREVKTAAKLSHPRIVAAYDADQAGELHFLVMEFVEGKTLAEVVRTNGPLSVRDACGYAYEAALGLQYAHQHGMVHRDVKPHNLMLTSKGQVKILDFGLARFVSESMPSDGMMKENVAAALPQDLPATSGTLTYQPGIATLGALTAAGSVVGTVDYVAPEQIANAHHADIRADIYGLGCTLYYFLIGRPPFPDEDLLTKLQAHAERAPAPITDFRHDVPAPLVALVSGMMAKRPEDRPQTPAVVADTLEPFTRVAKPRRGTGNQFLKALAASFFLCAALVALVGYFFGSVLYNVMTDQATVILVTDVEVEAGAAVRIKGHGFNDFILRPSLKKSITIPSGEYFLSLSGLAPGTDAELAVTHVTLSRGETREIHVTHQASGADAGRGDTRFSQGSLKPRRTITVLPPRGWVTNAIYLPDGKRVLTADTVHRICLWDLAEGKILKTFDGHGGDVWGLAMLSDGVRFLAGDIHGTVCCWNVEAGDQPEWSLVLATHPAIYTLLVDRAGKYFFATRSEEGIISRHAIGEQDQSAGVFYPGHRDKVVRLALSPDGTQMVSGAGDGIVRLWEVATGRELKRFHAHDGMVHAMAFLPDGKQIITGGYDHRLLLWDLQTETIVREFSGHLARIKNLDLHPNGHVLASCDEHGRLCLWDVTTGALLGDGQGNAAITHFVRFAPNGREMITGDEAGQLKVWDVPDKALEHRP